MTAREAIAIASLAGVATVTWWLSGAPARPTVANTDADDRPDFYMTEATLVTMDASGQRDRRLQTTALRHYPGADRTDLTNPVLDIFRSDAPPWTTVSERATVSAGGDLIDFQGDVTVTRPGRAGTSPIHLVTRNLRVRPKDDYAVTDEHARIRRDRSWLEGVGMEADLGEPMRLRLLAQVRSHHESQ